MRPVFNTAFKPKIAQPLNIRQGNASNFQLYNIFFFELQTTCIFWLPLVWTVDKMIVTFNLA